MLPGTNVRRDGGSWTLLTAHGHVLVEIARNPRARIRDIAAVAGIAERTAHGIIADLEAAGYLTRARSGRRTVYTVHPDRPFRHPAQKGHRVGPFLTLLASPGGTAAPGGRAGRDPQLAEVPQEMPDSLRQPVQPRHRDAALASNAGRANPGLPPLPAPSGGTLSASSGRSCACLAVRRSLSLPWQGLAADGCEDLSGVVAGQPSAGEEHIGRGDLVRVGGPPHRYLLAE
jgi:hypothetical protein